MKLIKLHMVCEKLNEEKQKFIKASEDLYVNIYHIGSFIKSYNYTTLSLRDGCRYDVYETPEEILQLIKEVE